MINISESKTKTFNESTRYMIIKSRNIKSEHHENYIVRKVCNATDRLIQEKVSSTS